MSSPVYFFAFFIETCIHVKYMADNRSYVGIRVPDELRYILLIFSFIDDKISIFCLMSQICLYAISVLYISLKILEARGDAIASTLNIILSISVLGHFVLIQVIGMLESSICEWNFRRKRR